MLVRAATRQYSTDLGGYDGEKPMNCVYQRFNVWMTTHAKSRCLSWAAVWMSIALTGIAAPEAADCYVPESPRILHVMSYHLAWQWNQDQLNGFKYGLNMPGATFKLLEMDFKRRNTAHWTLNMANQAGQLINTWKPDLVYINDDIAQAYVARYYVNHPIPFVFSGVNAAPEKYGFHGSKNITGVLEREHFVATIHLLRKLVPTVKKIAVIIDDGPTWPGVVSRMQSQLHLLPAIEITDIEMVHSFRGFKSLMLDLQDRVDAVAMLGIFTYKDQSGANVHFADVLKWTADHSRLPDFSFWDSRIPYGTLCAVAVSGYAQGLEAGRMARAILMEGRRPSSLSMKATSNGKPMISLARAEKLGIHISTDLLLSAQVVRKFQWNEALE
jgi:ABC-type uncharacterized transport system substrate-binding protein